MSFKALTYYHPLCTPAHCQPPRRDRHPALNTLILITVQDNIRAVRVILYRVDCITVPSHPMSLNVPIHIRSQGCCDQLTALYLGDHVLVLVSEP